MLRDNIQTVHTCKIVYWAQKMYTSQPGTDIYFKQKTSAISYQKRHLINKTKQGGVEGEEEQHIITTQPINV